MSKKDGTVVDQQDGSIRFYHLCFSKSPASSILEVKIRTVSATAQKSAALPKEPQEF